MSNADPVPGATVQSSIPGGPTGRNLPGSGHTDDRDPARAAASAAASPAATTPKDSPGEARGRRTLSTAFVMMGPDGRLTVELHDGRVLVLRDVIMRPRDYCGVQVSGGATGAKYCGGYADIASASVGPAAAPTEPPSATKLPRG